MPLNKIVSGEKNNPACPSDRQRGKDVGKTTSVHFLVVQPRRANRYSPSSSSWKKDARTCNARDMRKNYSKARSDTTRCSFPL